MSDVSGDEIKDIHMISDNSKRAAENQDCEYSGLEKPLTKKNKTDENILGDFETKSNTKPTQDAVPVEETENHSVQVVNEAAAISAKGGDPNLYVKTMSVKDFAHVLTACCAIPNLENIVMVFDTKGMQIYAHPSESSCVVTAFFNREMFTEYRVAAYTHRVLDKNRVDSLKKKIGKNVEFLEISACEECVGFTFSGNRVNKIGGSCLFSFNIADEYNNLQIVDVASAVDLMWHVSMSSDTFKENVNFIDDSNVFIKLIIDPKVIQLQGIQETGYTGEKIDQSTESKVDNAMKFEALFYKKHLKIVTSAKDLNRSLVVSFNLDSDTSVKSLPLVQFSYQLDQHDPQSHLSTYLLPFVADEY